MVPIILFGINWAWHTGKRFYDFGITFNTSPFPASLRQIGEMEFKHQLRSLQLNFLSPWVLANKNKKHFQTINLIIPHNNLKQLNKKLPQSGFDYVNGFLIDSKNALKVKTRYRGDFHYHWAYKKKSLRIKIKKNLTFQNLKSFNLIIPKSSDHLSNFLGYQLAKTMGLITPHFEFINLNLNGKNKGIHLLVEQLGNQTLKRHAKSSGTLFSGELVKNDRHSGINRNLFDHPQIWKIKNQNTKEFSSLKYPLFNLCKLVMAEQTAKTQKQLLELINLESWARFSAFETLSQTFHYDQAHNWRLYLDPKTNKFEPIVWDPVGWNPYWINDTVGTQLDIISSPIHQVLHQNLNFIRAREKVIKEFFEMGKDKVFLQKAKEIAKQLKIEVEKDPNLIVVDYQSLSPEEVRRAINKFLLTIEQTFKEVQEGFLTLKKPIQYKYLPKEKTIQIQFQGRKALEKLKLTFTHNLPNKVKGRIGFVKNGKMLYKDISNFMKSQKNQLELNLSLSSRFKLITKGHHPLISRRLKSEPAFYQLTLENLPKGNQLQEISGYFGIGDFISAKKSEYISPHSFQDFFQIIPS